MRSAPRLGFTILTASLALAFGAQEAGAQTSGTFVVSATVLSSCDIVGLVPLAFGNYDPGSATDTTGQTTITVTCNEAYEVGIDDCGAASVSNRVLVPVTGPDQLAFSLTCATEGDAKCQTNWGDTDGVDTLTGAPGVLQVYTVDGAIAAEQVVATGAYTATCTATLYL